MIVKLPSVLRSYTGDLAEVELDGGTVDELLLALDRRFPGVRFRLVDEAGRLRPHIKLYVGTEATDDLRAPVAAGDALQIVAALSGG